jgi:hypothetical protein
VVLTMMALFLSIQIKESQVDLCQAKRADYFLEVAAACLSGLAPSAHVFLDKEGSGGQGKAD